nr:MAG TPA_asm: hypothetical protein [Caudoviricetes sp.]
MEQLNNTAQERSCSEKPNSFFQFYKKGIKSAIEK